VDAQRKAWNEQQKKLRSLLKQTNKHKEALALFLSQHKTVHTVETTPEVDWSFAEVVLNDMTEVDLRRIPKNHDHSVAWCFWHMARIEDVTMNLLVDGRSQVLCQDNWLNRMKVTTHETGNNMNPDEIACLSATIDLNALRGYRSAVGRRTREIVSKLTSEELRRPVDPTRLQMIVDQGAVPASSGLLAYWGKRTIAGLLLMPPTRHNLVHLNEAERLKKKR
jgi:hypothetical protein